MVEYGLNSGASSAGDVHVSPRDTLVSVSRENERKNERYRQKKLWIHAPEHGAPIFATLFFPAKRENLGNEPNDAHHAQQAM